MDKKIVVAIGLVAILFAGFLLVSANIANTKEPGASELKEEAAPGVCKGVCGEDSPCKGACGGSCGAVSCECGTA